ncbi:MAG TPA: low affinity iron permease family protein [Candidatus Udaeobacter sp.]|jgi:low affinity Fe/Cu permease|nr:low affinity iron permease family protein [Candidatus Udaeobacter sp.]
MAQHTARFNRLAKWAATISGRPATFLAAALIIVVWAVTGPIFHFSDTWQLVINTGTTIITFLMVFLIQNTQNRDTEAIQLKLDELIRVTQGAHNALLDLEEMTDQDLSRVRHDYEKLAADARRNLGFGVADTDTPEVEVQKAVPDREPAGKEAPPPSPPSDPRRNQG